VSATQTDTKSAVASVQNGAVPEQPHILIVDDDRDIRKPLGEYFGRHGFRISVAADGREMERIIATSQIDLVVLDVMMPGEDGFRICKRLQESMGIPVILLTALAESTDRVVGLELGADDYVTKPFDPRELVARVRSVLRRVQMLPRRQRHARGTVKFDRWRFDFSRREVLREDSVAVRLSSGEHGLLVALIEHAGVTLRREQLLDLTRGRDAQQFERSIDLQISRLRRKLESDPRNPQIIQTKWGGGYVFAAQVEWAT
jgi:two-component system, OmpR family, response regulator